MAGSGFVKTILFLGPSLSAGEAEKLCHADIRGPAAMGDVARAVAAGAQAIVLIDGLFGNRPSVRHKEILFALSRGVPVIGASSMGALRAAELDSFGMLGHGAIYRAYASGALCEDDHVAVLYGPAELDHMALSDAMVDIAYALDSLFRGGAINKEQMLAARTYARGIHFSERTLLGALEAVIGKEQANHVLIHNHPPVGQQGLKAADARDTLIRLPELLTEADRKAALAPAFIHNGHSERFLPIPQGEE
jgi:hypothetical protein